MKISSGSNDEGFGVSKVTHRSDRVHEQTVDPGHLKIAAHQKAHGRPIGAGDRRGQQCDLLLGAADHAVDVSHRKTEIKAAEYAGFPAPR